MKQSYKYVYLLTVGDTVQLVNSTKKRKILGISDIDQLNVEIKLKDLTFAINKYEVVAVFN